jgi:excisionase family DNA binding protein
VISITEAALVLGVAPVTLRALAASHRIRAKVVGKTWITTRQEVERYRLDHMDRPGRAAVPYAVTTIPWPSNMYDAADLRVSMIDPEAGDAHSLVSELVRQAIARGAWTMAELQARILPYARARGLDLIYRDTSPEILVRGGAGD